MGLEFKDFDIDAEVDSLVFNIMMQNSMGLEEDEITDITDDIDFYEELEQVNTERVKNGEEPLTLEEFLDIIGYKVDNLDVLDKENDEEDLELEEYDEEVYTDDYIEDDYDDEYDIEETDEDYQEKEFDTYELDDNDEDDWDEEDYEYASEFDNKNN